MVQSLWCDAMYARAQRASWASCHRVRGNPTLAAQESWDAVEPKSSPRMLLAAASLQKDKCDNRLTEFRMEGSNRNRRDINNT